MLSHTRPEKLFSFLVCILYPLCSLQSTFCTYSPHFVSGLQFAVCILYSQVSVAPIQFIFGYTYIRATHTIYHKIPVCELIRHFPFFRVNTLLSFCKNVDITYNVSSNPPTPKKITLACIACLCFHLVTTC